MAALSEEQSIIRDQAKAWASEKAPVSAFRKVRDSKTALAYDDETWQDMVNMGWTGIIVPEQYGGLEMGYQTFGLILEELGRQLTASPLFASAYVGASTLVLGGSEAQKEALLPKIVDGSEIVTLALNEIPRFAPENINLQAEKTADGFKLNGSKTFVLEGMAATTFIVCARTSGTAGRAEGLTLFVVPADSSGISRKALSTVDSRGYAKINFDNVEVSADAVVGTADQGSDLLRQVLDRAVAGLGAEMLGVSGQTFDMTLEYLKTRKQFGNLIGSFQALGHRAAELFSGLEMSRSCAEAALQAIDADAENISVLSALSGSKVGDFLHQMSNQMIQIHGGIGMTDEFDAGLYLKRARALEAIYGSPAYHRDRYASLNNF